MIAKTTPRTTLIVDDNAAMCDSLADIIRESGYDVLCAPSCAEALRLTREHNPGVVLLDLKLPDGLGTTLLADLKRLDPDCVCIIITAFADVNSVIRALESGAFHYLHKPVRPVELLRLLERAFELIQLRDEKRATEQALRKREEQYHSLVENLNIGVYRISGPPDGRFIQANRAMVRIFGHDDAETFMTRSLTDFFQNGEERARFLDELGRDGAIKDREMLCLKRDGTAIWVSCTANAQYDDTGAVAWIDGVIEETTERKKLEDQLRHAQKMEAVGTLAGGVAHDFNNILTVILGNASMLQAKLKADDPLEKYVGQVIQAAENAAKLTRNLLAFSRKQLIDLRATDLNEVVGRMETLLLRLIGEDIELSTALSGQPLTVMADAGQIEQVLMNIAVNARAAMPDGGSLIIETGLITLDKTFIATHGYGEPGLYALVSVTDTGIGMDEQTRGRIFEPFFTTKEVGKGTGLGLSMAYGIVKHHNGYITCYSEPGRGTTFRVYLPLSGQEPAEGGMRPRAVPPGGDETILLAEDSDEVRTMMKEALEESGYRVVEAMDGEHALSMFAEHRSAVRLLILDVIMPRMNGREVFNEVRRMAPDIRVLFTSGYTGDILSRKGIIDEGLNFVSKPVAPADLLYKVRDILNA